MKNLAVLLLVLLIALPSAAQNNDDNRSRKEHIINAKIAFFTTVIGLTPDEAKIFWPIYNKCWDDIQKAHNQTRKNLKALKSLDASSNYSDEEIGKLTQKYVQSYIDEAELQTYYLKEFNKILPAKKVAKIYIAEDGFRKKLTEMWKEQSQNNPGQTPPPPRGDRPELPECQCEPL